MKITKITSAVLAAIMTIPAIWASADIEQFNPDLGQTLTDGVFEYILISDDSEAPETQAASITGVVDKSVTEVKFPEKIDGHPVTVLGAGLPVLDGCYSVESVTIPESITTIREYGFENVPSLTDVYYTGTGEQWRKIKIRKGNSSLVFAAFHYAEDKPNIDDIPDLGGLRGDADCNGRVNAADATAVLRHTVELERLTEEGLDNADVNGDGVINTADATLILKITVNLV